MEQGAIRSPPFFQSGKDVTEGPMRPLLLILAASLPWPALATSDGLAECASVVSAVARLDCFDELARKHLADHEAHATKAPAVGRAFPREEASPARGASTPSTSAADPPTAEPGSPGRFGMRASPDPVDSADYIEARIDDVRRTPLGEHVLTLSNGQVWMENEPGRRPIAAGQDVIIRKHRWHFEMELASQPDVAVRRVR